MVRWILMRHADALSGGPDLDRRLSERGMDDARAMGSWLREKGWLPDGVVMSPAVRCRQTAEQVLASGGIEAEATVVQRLYHGQAPAYLQLLRESPDATTLLVGHLPAIEEAVLALAATAARDAMGHLMAPGTAACFDGQRLVALQRPGELRAAAGGL